MGNSASGDEEVPEAVCRDMSAYQLSLFDGRGEGRKKKDTYVCLNKQIFNISKDLDNVKVENEKAGEEKTHRGHVVAKNEDKVEDAEISFYKENFQFVGNLIETKEFTVETLKPFNGVDEDKIYLSARGLVFNVTLGESFYGPDGGYHIFAGRNAQRALAKTSLKIEDVDNTSLDDLEDTQQKTLDDWIDKYHGKYIHVGYLVDPDNEKANLIKRCMG